MYASLVDSSIKTNETNVNRHFLIGHSADQHACEYVFRNNPGAHTLHLMPEPPGVPGLCEWAQNSSQCLKRWAEGPPENLFLQLWPGSFILEQFEGLIYFH